MRIRQTTKETILPKGNVRSIPTRQLGLTLVVGLALAVGALLAFAALANEMLEGDTQRFDDWVREGIHQYASPALTSFMRVVTVLGAPSVLLALSVVSAVGFLFARKDRGLFLLVITMIGAKVLDVVLKLSFHRTRPVPFFDALPPSSYSFPSGHAIASFCFYSTVAAIISVRTRSPGVRITVWALAALQISLIGISRIYLGVHYPSDVLAGYAAAFIWVMMVSLGDRALKHRASEPG
jgi:undecaprenyl-diphosphatase